MENIRTIQLSKSVFADNDRQAGLLRDYLRSKGVLLVNVMSSPGAGKTSTLIALIRALGAEYRIGVMEADIDSDVDAVQVAEQTGCKSIQLHTGGMCHLDAGMTWQGLSELGLEGLDLVFLENVGNLVCPAEYDTGALLDMTILSVPEGDDKPLKYPLIYEKCGLVLINKSTLMPLQTLIYQLNVRIDTDNMTSEQLREMAKMSSETLNAAKVIIALAPLMCIYPFLQKYFVSGLTLGAVKE